MVAYNFNKQFAGDVASGIKTQTIRKEGMKNPPNPGDQVQLYTGQRTKYCRQIGLGVCSEVAQIVIERCAVHRCVKLFTGPFFGLATLREEQIEELANKDGFETVEAFFDFFTPPGVEQFYGYLIKWKPVDQGDNQ